MYFVSTHNNPPNDLRGLNGCTSEMILHLEIQIEPEMRGYEAQLRCIDLKTEHRI